MEKTRSNPLPARGHSAILLSNTRISHIFSSNISLLASAISSWNSNFIAKVSSQKTIESVRILFMLPGYNHWIILTTLQQLNHGWVIQLNENKNTNKHVEILISLPCPDCNYNSWQLDLLWRNKRKCNRVFSKGRHKKNQDG